MQLPLRAWRLAREKSQDDMAKMLGICRDTYNSWEKEPWNISLANGRKISDYLDVPIDDIIFLPEDSTKCRETV